MAYRVFFEGVPEVRLTVAPGNADVPQKLVIPGFALCHWLPQPCGGFTREHTEAMSLATAIARQNGLRVSAVKGIELGCWRATFTSRRRLKPEKADCYMPVATVTFEVSPRTGVGDERP